MQVEESTQQQIQQQSGNISFDLGILTVFDSNALWGLEENIPEEAEKREAFLKKRAESNINQLFHQLSAIRTEREAKREAKDEQFQIHDFERSTYEVDLPKRTSILPRSNKIPEPKKLTKWERFAKEKGIRKQKKRSRMIFDENAQEMVPRWGPYSKKNFEEQNIPFIEVKPGDDIYEDPFQKKKLQRKLVKERQKLNELKNKLESKGLNAKKVISEMTNGQAQGRSVSKGSGKKEKTIAITNEDVTAGGDGGEEGNKKKIKMSKGQIQEARSKARQQRIKGMKDKARKNLTVAQMSTASMGVFDRRAHRQEEQKKPKRRKEVPNFSNKHQERSRNLDILDMVNRNLESGNKKLKQE